MEPRILVLDECTTQLDPMGSEEIFDIVKQLNAAGVACILVGVGLNALLEAFVVEEIGRASCRERV